MSLEYKIAVQNKIKNYLRDKIILKNLVNNVCYTLSCILMCSPRMQAF